MSKTTKDIVGENPLIFGHVNLFSNNEYTIRWYWMEVYRCTTYKSFMKHEHFGDMDYTIELLTGNNYGQSYTMLL